MLLNFVAKTTLELGAGLLASKFVQKGGTKGAAKALKNFVLGSTRGVLNKDIVELSVSQLKKLRGKNTLSALLAKGLVFLKAIPARFSLRQVTQEARQYILGDKNLLELWRTTLQTFGDKFPRLKDYKNISPEEAINFAKKAGSDWLVRFSELMKPTVA